MGVVPKKGSYWLDYRVDGKRYRKKIGINRSVAEAAWAKVQTEIAENKFLDIKRFKPLRFEEFAQQYLRDHCEVNHRSLKKSSAGRLKTLGTHFNGKLLSEITPQAIEKYKAERRQAVSPATVNRELACLKNFFNKASEWNKWDGANPVRQVRMFKEDNQRERYLTRDEMSKLVESCNGVLKPLVVVALHTGMRRGELFGLRWEDIDFEQGIIWLLVTKSGKRRNIPMNDEVRRVLDSIERHPKGPYVFCSKSGKRFEDVRRSFNRALQRAGITNFKFHDLRHTFASQLVMSGVSLNTVRELMGHSTLAMTQRYSHLSSDHKTKAVNLLCFPQPASVEPQPLPPAVASA